MLKTFSRDEKRVDELNDLLLELVTPSVLVYLIKKGATPVYEFMRYITFHLHFREAEIRTTDDWVKALAPVSSAKTCMRAWTYTLGKNHNFQYLGAGFCRVVFKTRQHPRVIVKSEDQSDIVLLETEIKRDSAFYKDEDNSIGWAESHGANVRLSFQEPEGCIIVWRFISGYIDLYNI